MQILKDKSKKSKEEVSEKVQRKKYKRERKEIASGLLNSCK